MKLSYTCVRCAHQTEVTFPDEDLTDFPKEELSGTLRTCFPCTVLMYTHLLNIAAAAATVEATSIPVEISLKWLTTLGALVSPEEVKKSYLH